MNFDKMSGCDWEQLLEMLLGAECVKLAQVAAFFSPDGVPQHILRHLWKTVVAPDLDEKKFARALEILRDHNIFQSLDPVRINPLDHAAILRTAKEAQGLEEAIGKSLAAYVGMFPEYWLLLADHVGILRFVPVEVLLFREWPDEIPIVALQTRLLCANPAFQDKCQWDAFYSGDWAELLCKQPQFANRCPWEKLVGADWSKLLQAQLQFAERCPWEKLERLNWAKLLGGQPQFADRCSREKLDGWRWADLPQERPQFSDRCPWEKLEGSDWAWLLRKQPQFADRCSCWNEMDDGDAWDLIHKRPELKAYFSETRLHKIEERSQDQDIPADNEVMVEEFFFG